LRKRKEEEGRKKGGRRMDEGRKKEEGGRKKEEGGRRKGVFTNCSFCPFLYFLFMTSSGSYFFVNSIRNFARI
jgi:hypothetical protein